MKPAGYKENTDGSFSIYTKGADRARLPGLIGYFGSPTGDLSYDGGHQLWSSLIDGLNDFLEPQNGAANIVMDKNTTGQRPKWDKIKEKLKTLTPMDVIPCD